MGLLRGSIHQNLSWNIQAVTPFLHLSSKRSCDFKGQTATLQWLTFALRRPSPSGGMGVSSTVPRQFLLLEDKLWPSLDRWIVGFVGLPDCQLKIGRLVRTWSSTPHSLPISSDLQILLVYKILHHLIWHIDMTKKNAVFEPFQPALRFCQSTWCFAQASTRSPALGLHAMSFRRLQLLEQQKKSSCLSASHFL